MFLLNKQLADDSFFITDLKICHLLLMNNTNYPWLILVPKIDNAVELTDLDFATQSEILAEINLVAKILQKKFRPTKLNIASLGNIVKQLHVHIIARFENDKVFPKPVWGDLSQPYEEQKAQDLIMEIKQLLENNAK